MKIKLLIVVFFFISGSFRLYSQKDSSIYCDQYVTAIKYIKQDPLVKHEFKLRSVRFRINSELCSGGIDPLFFEQYISHLFQRPFDSINRHQIDSAYQPIVSNRGFNSFVIKCLFSDSHPNLFLQVCRENDSVFCFTVSEITKHLYLVWCKRRLKPKPAKRISYLFIMSRNNAFEKVFYDSNF